MLWSRLMDGLRAARVQGTLGPGGTSLAWHSADPLAQPVEAASSPRLALHPRVPRTPVCAQPLHPTGPPAARGSPRSFGVCPPPLAPSVCVPSPHPQCPPSSPGRVPVPPVPAAPARGHVGGGRFKPRAEPPEPPRPWRERGRGAVSDRHRHRGAAGWGCGRMKGAGTSGVQGDEKGTSRGRVWGAASWGKTDRSGGAGEWENRQGL